ncbi:hypothetical protein CC85DRAFT_328359 [Cutaneotrichosporon oleaginosum]|uniref:Uncharacterized protein n=1 Tax=Cutaneotrichosporon oleaginosum TaxID=879819 RepID=A0A0J0XMK6_9TREE|nr:uncharacterized protein CC85DRAFT_328359 [Cutaneotrichosporon oleaginosum]KLT42303.1 hypothetical protein CC85DRAFT_328359 [Cutaneotrichosporon oleaginosum]TXT11475.1 hypothetical protein COLE_01885 [Cutaneotrichosporon oleaginosum]
MEDPWAVWGKPVSADKMRMPSSTPSPEPADLDPWAKPTTLASKPRPPSPTRFSPKSPSKLSQVTLPSPPLNTGLGAPSRVPKLDGWDDVGWGTPKAEPEPKPTALPGRLRSPSLDLDAGWGAEPSKPDIKTEAEPDRRPSPSPASSPRKSVESRVLSDLPRLSNDISRLSGDLPRLSLEADAFSRPGSAAPPLPDSRPGSASLPVDLDARLSHDSSRASLEISPPSPPAPIPIHSIGFDTTDLGAGFATPFRPSSPKEGPGLNVPSELKRSVSIGSDFGGFADVGGDDAWGDTSWKEEDAGWKEDAHGGGWDDVPRRDSPVKQSQQELDWEAAQRRLAAADARAPHERVMRLRREWEAVAEDIIGEHKLHTTEAEETALDDGARVLQESVRETLRALTEVPDTSFAFGHSATRERYAQALSRAPPNSMTLLRAPRPRRAEGGGLDFGPGLEGWAARSRLGEPEAMASASQPEPEQAKGWGFWRRQATPKPLVTSGGAVLEVKTDLDSAGIGSAPASALSKPPSISSRPGTPSDTRPSMSARASISSVPSMARQGSISAPSPLSANVTGPPTYPVETPAFVPEKKPEPSRMSRLFRWGKKEEKKEGEDKELELGESDFAFLDQVPSASGPDLIGGGMSSIDEVLSMKKEVPLPAPLAPPPRSGPSSARPSMGAQPAPPKNDAFDLFASLDFDDATPAASTATDSTPAPSSSFGWDDLLAPSTSSTSAPPVPKLSAPPRMSTPPVGLGGLLPQRSPTPPVMGTGLQPTRSATPPLRSQISPPTPERPRYGPSGPALGAHSRHRSTASAASGSGLGGISRKPMSPPPRKPTSPPPPPKDYGFGDLSFGFGATPSAAAPPSASNDLFGVMAASPPTSARSPPMMGVATLSPSLPPTRAGIGMGGMATLAPSPPPSARSPFALAPSPARTLTPPLPTSDPTAPSGPAPASAHDDDFGDFGDFDAPAASATAGPAADDDFGDFGDFGDAATSGFNTGTSTGFDTDSTGFGSFNGPAYSSFGASGPPKPAQPSQPSQLAADPFDFSAFESTLTPSRPPPPIAKSIPPTPIEKSPKQGAGDAPASFVGASLSRNSSLSRTVSQSPPVFARPAGLPTGLTKSRQSSFTDATGRVRPLPPAGVPTPAASRRTPSVDHRATFTLLAAAQARDATADSGPLSPVPEPLSPPPTGPSQSFASLLPPPPGGVRRPSPRGGAGGGLIDLLDD